MNTWMLLDMGYLTYRSFHAMHGRISTDGHATEVLFGIFRDIISLSDLFSTKQFAFCFDGGYDYRLEILPEYKGERIAKAKEMTEEELQARKELRRQVSILRKEYLPDIGFQNVLYQKGVEADDLIASCCKGLALGESAVIVSADQDLWQLLDKDTVVIWNPGVGKILNQEFFEKNWKISPRRWNEVKALAGCISDGVPGIKGVGERTAAKFLRGVLKETSRAYKLAVNGGKIRKRNLKVVTLPGPWTEKVELKVDRIKSKDWDRVMKGLKMKSLVGRFV